MHRKIIPILVVSLIITSIALATTNATQASTGESIRKALDDAYHASNQGIKPVIVNGEVYIPVSEVENLNKPLAKVPEANIITDIDTAYQTLTDLHEKFLDRMKNSTAKTKDKTIELLDKNMKDTLYDIGLLNSIQIYPNQDNNVSSYIFIAKDFLHTSLMLYYQATLITSDGLKNTDKDAKKQIQSIKPAAELFGKYTEASFKTLDEEYKKYQEETKQGN